MDLLDGRIIQGLQNVAFHLPHIMMVPGGASDLRFTIEFECGSTLLPTSSQVQGMTLWGVRWQVSFNFKFY